MVMAVLCARVSVSLVGGWLLLLLSSSTVGLHRLNDICSMYGSTHNIAFKTFSAAI